MMRLGPLTTHKRERTSSQERALELESRPTKRFNAAEDDLPEEGELEDDPVPPHPVSLNHATHLPPRPTPSPSKTRWDTPVREKPFANAPGSLDDDRDVLGEMAARSSGSRANSAAATAAAAKKIAFPFKKKDKPGPPIPPPSTSSSATHESDGVAEVFNRSRKEPPLPPPHPSLPPPPVFAGAAPVVAADRGRDSSPSKRERRHSREREPPPPRRERSRERDRRVYDEYGRDQRPPMRDWERDDRDGDRHRTSHNRLRSHDSWVASEDPYRSSPPEDWRTRPDDTRYAPREHGRDWERRHDDRDRRPHRPSSPSSRFRTGADTYIPSTTPSPQARPHRLARSRSRTPPSRSRSISRSSSASPRSRSPSRQAGPSHHPSRLPQRAALPPTPPPIPRPLDREDLDLGDEDLPPPAPSSLPPSRSFQPFNFGAKTDSKTSRPADLPPRPPPAPLPDYEPKSLPPPVLAAAISSTRQVPTAKNVLADDEEDEGEVKEDDPPPRPPKLPPPSVPPPAKSHQPNVEPKEAPKVPHELDDAIERKIREMEAAQALASVPKPVPLARPKEKPATAEKPVQRPTIVRRTADQEKSAYGKAFAGVSRLRMYRKEDKLGEGTFGEVFKATHVETKAVVALKRILMHNEFQGVPITAVREIKLLKKLNHPNVVELVDIVMELANERDEKGSIYMVFPYMDHDLAGLLENPSVQLQPSQIKLYMKQLLEGTAYLHRNHILHRDIKAANLLISNDGILRIADFGLARPISKEWADKRGYTNCVVTRWYRPPELLMGAKVYDGAVDMWGCGCLLAEMFERKPILMGESDIGQLEAIFQLCGSPNEDVWPGWRDLPGCEGYEVKSNHQRNVGQRFRMLTNDTCDLIIALLALDPSRRLSADDALDHPYFWTDPLPADPKNMPKWNASKEYDRRKKAEQQQQTRGPPPVHYRPQQPQGGFNANGGRGPFPPHGGHGSSQGYNNKGGGFNSGPHPGRSGLPPPRLGDGLPPGVAPPNRGQQRPPTSVLPPLRYNGGSMAPVPGKPPGLPAPPPPPAGLPDPAFGGPGGYKGPLVRGGKFPERAYTSGSANNNSRYGGNGGRRDDNSRSNSSRGGGLPYD